jgi:membrane-associated protease RseP (regulator of RpoE activity)
MTVGSMVPTSEHPVVETVEEKRRSHVALALLLAALLALGVWNWRFLVIFVLLVISIILHEAGHYLGARWGGMKATEFFVGFGPRIWSTRRGDTELGVKAIVLGGYVKTPGMTNLEEVPPEDEPYTYRAQGYGRRARMVLAGPLMNLLIALVGFCLVFTFFAEPVAVDTGQPYMSSLVADGPARAAGAQPDDRLLAIDGTTFASDTALRDYLRAHPGDEVTLTVERDGRQLELTATLADTNPTTGEKVGFLGVGFALPTRGVERNPAEALQRGFTEFGRQVGGTVKGVAQIFSPSGIARLFNTVTGETKDDPTKRASSIVGIGKYGSDAVRSGLAATIWFVASINLALGLFNLLPVLPFDGGHLLIATYEKLRSKRGKPEYRVDFAKVMPLFGPALLVLLFVVGSAMFLDLK